MIQNRFGFVALSGSRSVSQGFPFSGLLFRRKRNSTRSVSAYHWQAFGSNGLPMMRLGTNVRLCVSLACPLRLRTDSTTQRSEGMPMMRLPTLAHHWQAVGVFASNRRRPVNDAVGHICVAFAHHWHAFLECGIVLVPLSYHFGIVFGSLLRIYLTMLWRCCSNTTSELVADE